MPEISRFFGLVITMYLRDHPPPHFHVWYGGMRAQVRIAPPGLLNGDLPPRLLALALRWAKPHEAELLDNRDRMRAHRPPVPIAPLE